jgi:hypothetical protein
MANKKASVAFKITKKREKEKKAGRTRPLLEKCAVDQVMLRALH